MERTMVTNRAPTLADYKLPIKSEADTQNFDAVTKKQWYNLAELRSGDFAGITETDSKTSGKKDGPYTPINTKVGSPVHPKGTNLGLSVKLDKHTSIG